MIKVPRKYWGCLALCTLFLLFYANNALPITDTVESNYTLTAKEMLNSGDWISPQIYGNYWFDKPVLFYVLTAASYFLLGCTEFASRLFPALFGFAGVCLVAWGGRKLYTEGTGFYSALVLASSFEFFLISKSVITDAVLFFFFSLALLSFLIAYTRKEPVYYYGFYVGCAFAVLTKGPIGILLPGLIVFLFLLIRRDWAELQKMRLFSGTILFLLIAMPWYIAMYMLHGNAFIDMFFGTHNFLRATVSEHPKDNVIYYYTLVTILAVSPWTGFLPQLIKKLCRYPRKEHVMEDKTLFLLLWVVTIFVFFQCMATKYLTYTYPLLFPMALLLGHFFDEQGEEISLVNPFLWNGFFFTIFIAAGFYAVKTQILPVKSVWQIAIPVVIGTAFVLSTRLWKKKAYMLLCIALTAFFFNVLLIQDICLPLTESRSTKTVAAALQNLSENKTIYVYGNYPTSAVFYADKKIIKLVPKEQLSSFQPQSFNWNSKNVMPYAEFQSSVEKNDSLVLIRENEYSKFITESPVKDWVIAAERNGWVILKRG